VVNRRTVVKARKGDNVARIAARYRLKATDVADWNDVSAKSSFKTGEQVVVFLPVRSARGSNTAKAPPARKTAVARGRGKATTTASRKTSSPVQARMNRPGSKLAGGR